MAADETNVCVFQWKIKNISHCWLKQTQRMESPTFTADVLEGTKWLLRLYPEGLKVNTGEKYVGILLGRKQDCIGPNDIEVRYQFAFLDKDGSILKEITLPKRNFRKGDAFGYRDFEVRKLIFITNREIFLPDDTLTVQCVIWKEGNTPAKPKRFYGHTIFRVNRRSFVCRIDDFSTLKSGLKYELKDDLLEFDLVLNEGLDFEKNLLLNIVPCEGKVKYFSLKISIIDSEGKKEDCGTHKFFLDDLKKGVLSTLLCSKKLMGNKSKYLPNDVLSLDCECVYSDGTLLYEYCGCGIILPELMLDTVGNQTECNSDKGDTPNTRSLIDVGNQTECNSDKGDTPNTRSLVDVGNQTECNSEKEDIPSTRSLVDDLQFMYTDALCSDTVLRTPTQTFPAHKGILSARSPVFRSMFRNDMKKNSGHVNIADFDDDTILRMLKYIYTDSLEDLHCEAASQLYAIADKYQILSLRSRCSCLLKEKFCPTNACDVLVLADLHQDDDLKTAVVNYILEQRKQIFCSQEFKDFMNSHLKLAADVMYKNIYQE